MPFEVNHQEFMLKIFWLYILKDNYVTCVYAQALLAFIMEHEQLFTTAEYLNLLKVLVPGREIPADAQHRVKEVLSH